MNNKQSSVEWLISQLQKSKDWHRVLNEVSQMSSARIDILEQAKAMHKEEIMWSYMNVNDDRDYRLENVILKEFAEQFYNETFGK